MAQRPQSAVDAKNAVCVDPRLEKIKIGGQLYNVHDPGVDALAANIDTQVSYLIGEIDALAASKQDNLTIDNTVTSNGTNPVEGQAIYSYVSSAIADYDTNFATVAKTGNYYDLSNVPTSYITKDVDDLTHYYDKDATETYVVTYVNSYVVDYVGDYAYSKAEVSTRISEILGDMGEIKQFIYLTAASLPTASADEMYKIYLIPAPGADTDNIKEEYIVIDRGEGQDPRYVWEMLGTTKMAMTDYADWDGVREMIVENSYLTTGDFSAQIASYYTKDEVQSILTGYQTSLTWDNAVTENSSNQVTSGMTYTAIWSAEDRLNTRIDTLDGDAVKTVNSVEPDANGNIVLDKETFSYSQITVGHETNQTDYTMYVTDNTFTAVTKVNGESV